MGFSGQKCKETAMLWLRHYCSSAASLHWCGAADGLATAVSSLGAPSASLAPAPGEFSSPGLMYPLPEDFHNIKVQVNKN